MTNKTKERQRRAIFAEVYEKYYPLVFNILYSKLSKQDLADDMCQEVFITYYTKLEQVENPRKWLLGTLKYSLLNYFKQKHKNHVDIEDVFNDINLQFVNGMRDTRLIIEEAIAEVAMTDEERLIFEYLSYYNYTQENTAKIMGLTRKKTIYKYSKVLRRIMDYLAQKGIKNIEDLL